MSDAVENSPPCQAIGGIRVPKEKLARPRRIIPGTGDAYAVTQTGQVYSAEHNELWDADNWPRTWLPIEDKIVELNVIAAVAHLWLDQERRDAIRAEVQLGARHEDTTVMALEKSLQVSKHAIVMVANMAEADIVPIKVIDDGSQGNLCRIEHGEITNYQAFLHEKYRPPSQRGNTSALHVHRMMVGGYRYSFFARGSRRWVYTGDKVSFNYRITSDGFRNVLSTSLVTVDKTGRPIKRGDRRTKSVLRVASTRLPARRTDWKD